MTRLKDGAPVIGPKDTDFGGKKIADVSGWAPSPASFFYASNTCNDKKFENYDWVLTGDEYTSIKTGKTYTKKKGQENDMALAMLLDEAVDGVWLFANQAYNY